MLEGLQRLCSLQLVKKKRCKMMQSITSVMVKDHKGLMGLFNDLKKIKDKDRNKANELFKKLDKQLKNHFNIEENAINLAFGRNGSALPIISSLKSEHGSIREILDGIRYSIKGNGHKIGTSNLYLMLEHHKNVEERLFYPELDELLSEKDKGIITEKIRSVR